MSTRIPAADYPPKVGEVVGQSDHTFLAEAEAKASSSSSSSSSSEDVSASLLSGEEPTAQIVAFLRYIAPQWRTPGAIVRGKHEEDIGRDLFAHHFLSQRQRKVRLEDRFSWCG
jgi:hypothetical protein